MLKKPTKQSLKQAAIGALQKNGKIDPLDLIDAARHPEHPCHDDFTWDVAKAAAKCWRDEARALIRSCKFEVLVEDVTEPVVQFVASPDQDDATFISLPKIRAKGKMSAVLTAELAALHGVTSRVYGIALAKQNIVGANVVAELGVIRDSVAALKAGMED